MALGYCSPQRLLSPPTAALKSERCCCNPSNLQHPIADFSQRVSFNDMELVDPYTDYNNPDA